MPLKDEEKEFERAKLCYSENSEHARQLNTQLNTIPALAVTVTGGLWYGAAATASLDEVTQFGLLVLAGLSDLVLIFAGFRIRNVFESHLEVLEAFYPKAFPPRRAKNSILPELARYSMIKMYCGLILIAAIASFVGAYVLYWPAPNNKWMLPGVMGLLLLISCSWILITKGIWKSFLLLFLWVLLILATVASISHSHV
jgi:hypothetical protein